MDERGTGGQTERGAAAGGAVADARQQKGAGRIGRIRWPWAIAFALMVCVVWGNSLVPGDDSGSLSMAVVDWIRGVLAAIGLPSDWVTNFVVRKTAHFTEYLVLALIGMQAFGPHRRPLRLLPAAATAIALVAVPCIDETIQLSVSGRSGQITDVLIDCSGILTGALLTLLGSRLWRRLRRQSDPA